MFGDHELASWGSRVGAYLLDWAFVLLVTLAVGIPLAASGGGAETAGGWVIVGGLVLGWPIYAAIFEGRAGEHRGQTLGKQIVGIRVVRDNGQPLGFGYAFLREFVVRWLLLGFIGGFLFIVPLLDDLWPLWDETNRALHDMVVSTHVVRAEAPPTGLGIQ
jgi:uncharacterized RDD family membrane protein YckC